MRKLIDLYILDHELAWTPATTRSERYRLNAVASVIDGNPDKLWAAIQGQKPYTRVTTWTRVAKFWDWAIAGGHANGTTDNLYRTFRRKNARLFKNAYVKRLPSITLEEAKARIARLSDETIKKKATDILRNGLRFNDWVDSSNGEIRGKGGKIRELLGPIAPGQEYSKSYNTFWRRLNEVGLKPHDLRKIFASKLAKNGLNAFDLCRVLGWEKIQTATLYVASSTKSELKSFVRKSVH